MSVESHDLGDVASLAALAGYGDSYVVPGDEVYVVPEDTDYVYRNPGTNPVADGFNIIKAIFLPGYWERRGGSSGGAGLRFNTVALGASGSGRLIDVGLSGLVDGVSTAWVESVKDTWRWDATSTLTADNITVCNPTANGANPGRFIRELIPAPEWQQQATWFVDTAGNNENDGASALTPLQTDAEIQRRWGQSPELSIPISITWAQSPSTLTSLRASILEGASVTLIGTRTVTRSAVTITAVTAQNRATQTPLAITGAGLDATDVGKLAIITSSGSPANVGAYAAILKDNGGGNVMVGKFGTSTVALPFTEITPAVNDVIDVVSLTQLSIGRVEFTQKGQALAAASPTRNCIVFDSIKSDGSSVSLQGSLVSNNCKIFFQRCITQNLNTSGVGVVAFAFDFCGGLISNILNSANFRARKTAFMTGGITVAGSAPFVQFDADCYFENATLQTNQGAVCNTQGVALFDRSVASMAINMFSGSTVRQSGAVADWGTANAGFGLFVRSNCSYTYQTKPNVNGGLGAGRESSIGGIDTQYAAYPATGAVNLTNFASATLTA